MTNYEAVILAVVEGLTEYLPVSSTGHLILTEAALKLQSASFNKIYIINIQFGAILSVLLLYWRRFFQSIDFYKKIAVAFLPAAVLGFLLNDFIDGLLESVTTVAVSLIIGGIAIIWADRHYRHLIENQPIDDHEEVVEIDEFGNERKSLQPRQMNVSYKTAFMIGIFQTLAMIPGVSRSAATILGGLFRGMNIRQSAEFSFFLAVPTIFAASAYKLLKGLDDIRGTDMGYLITGNLISFVVAMLAIKFFIELISRYGMRFFGYYRIIVGAAILILMALGYKLEIPG